MVERALVVERRGGVAILRLNEPRTKNALRPPLRDALGAAVCEAADDSDIRCLMITGTDDAFCAGGDVRSFVEPASAWSNYNRLRRSHSWMMRLMAGDKPLVVAVNGVAAGAGFGLAMMGDLVLAAESAYFQSGFANVGLAPDYGLGLTLPRMIGTLRAKEILLLNRRVTAHEALAIGMVNQVCPAADLMDAALELACRLAAGPTVAHGITKSLIDFGNSATPAEYLREEAQAQAIAFNSADHREGVRAFLEKRAPLFAGR